MPSSLVKEALGSTNAKEQANASVKTQPTTPAPVVSASDEELLRIAASLDISIKIIGCGGGGCNTINSMRRRRHQRSTALRHQHRCQAPADHSGPEEDTHRQVKDPRPGRRRATGGREEAARENDSEIRNFLNGANIVFVTAGMGGGTGTGSAHYVAAIAKEQIKALTLGVVTIPFKAEGTVRMENALSGLNKLRQACDTTIVVPNDKLLEMVPKLPIEAAFKVADEVLMQTIKGLTEIITKPGLVNLDYADIQTVMNEGGVAFVGIGEANRTRTIVSVRRCTRRSPRRCWERST